MPKVCRLEGPPWEVTTWLSLGALLQTGRFKPGTLPALPGCLAGSQTTQVTGLNFDSLGMGLPTVGWSLSTIKHAIIADHACDAQAISVEDIVTSPLLDGAMRTECTPSR